MNKLSPEVKLVNTTIDDNAVVENASDGIALKGFLIKDKENGKHDIKEKILEIKGKIRLSEPDFDIEEHKVEFMSNNESSLFHHFLETSRARHVQLYKGQTFEITSHSKLENKQDISNQSKGSFYSNVSFVIVPVKSCELNAEYTLLTNDSLKRLKVIENLVRSSADKTLVTKKCQEFFERFGSHVNLGKLHFGGIYVWKATYHSNEEIDPLLCKAITEDTLNSFKSVAYSKIGLDVGGKTLGSNLRRHMGSSTELSKYLEKDLSNTHLSVVKFGGLTESDFIIWKNGLKFNNCTWSLINRETFVGIWELIRNHKTEFTCWSMLSKLLQEVWTSMKNGDKLSVDTNQIYNRFVGLKDILSTADQDQKIIRKDFSLPVETTGQEVSKQLTNQLGADDTKSEDNNADANAKSINVFERRFDCQDKYDGQLDSGKATNETDTQMKKDPEEKETLDNCQQKDQGQGQRNIENRNVQLSTETASQDEVNISANTTHITETVQIEETGTKTSQNMLQLIEKLGLTKFYPDKMELRDVMEIKREHSDVKFSNIPWIFLKNLIMINFTSRDKMIQEHLEEIGKGSKTKDTEDDDDLFDDILGDDSILEDTINPLDLILAVFKCSSPTLKQIIATKLFICKLAIPLVYPSDSNQLPLVNIWPIRALIIEGKTQNGPVQDTSIDYPVHIVSFCRIGRPAISKSKLLNEILTEEYHNTFFNKDCPLGMTNRLVSQGLIETSWYLPSENSKTLTNVTMFLNLRGNGYEHIPHLQLMSRLSTVVVVMIEIDSLKDKTTQEILLDVHRSVSGIYIAVDATKRDKTATKTELQNYSKGIGEMIKYTKFGILASDGQVESFSIIKTRMRKGISELVKNVTITSLSNKISCVDKTSFRIDEEIAFYGQTKLKAQMLLQFIPNDLCNVKEQVVPLQGRIWRSWSQQLKAVNKSSCFKTLQERGKIEVEMDQKRQQQLQVCLKLGNVMQTFLDVLLNDLLSKDESNLFISWLKLFLDERSRKVLPAYLAKYQSDWKILKSARDRKELEQFEKLREELNTSEYNLAEASFGFEHLLREVGQIYEALTQFKTKLAPELTTFCEKLPQLGAKLFLMGHPFEVMDGDAANVPLTWVKAVLNCLKDMIGDKKMLALSILGIQSSGKSTFLNTMFGLQFAVSAGRCTRGVFMQLVPVKGADFPFDYVLVIDTEGLRAPELAHQKYNHDNELATFVIGLGDVTIVNIKGENTAEVKDVLQIAVHAFLRLKLANERLNLKQSCMFVHQNVPAYDASDKMMQGRQKFVETLDEMTKEAADQENILDIQSFNQVIDFDIEKNVWYFSDLWRGDPPMAPANPGYSRSVYDVKKSVLFRLTEARDTYLTISYTITRIEDLWIGILKDDFVFSFRNSLELKAYNSMERKCQAIYWDLEKFIFEFVLSDGKAGIINCSNAGQLDQAVNQIMSRLKVKVYDQVDILIKEMDTFVENSNLKDVMIQWTNNKITRLRLLADDLLDRAKLDIIKTKEEIRIERMRKDEGRNHQKEINDLARKLANDLKGRKPSEHDLKCSFDSVWTKWISQFASKEIEDILPIKDQIDHLLVEKFERDARYLDNTSKVNRSYDKMKRLVDTIQVTDISSKIHISIKKHLYIMKAESKDLCKEQTVDVTNKIFRQIDDRLAELNTQDVRFDLSYVTGILNIINSDINNHNEHTDNEYKFNLLPPYKAMIVTHVVQYVTIFFTRLNEKYNRKHSPKAQMEDYKGTAWALFKNLVESKTEDVIAAVFFREELIRNVTEHVSERLQIDVLETILLTFSHEKYTLMKSIMISLVKQNDFEEFKSFIQDPSIYAKTYLTDITDKAIFDTLIDGVSKYGLFAKKHIEKIFVQIAKSIVEATDLCQGLTEVEICDWRDLFVADVNSTNILPLSNDILVHVQSKKLSDVQNFKQTLLEQLDEMKSDVLQLFTSTSKNTVLWKDSPISKIMNKLWGCEEKCMYCKETCMNTDKEHVKFNVPHQCIQHRPQGIGGFRWGDDGPLCVEFCNYWVQTDQNYTVRENGIKEVKRKYKEYKQYHPDWDITPTSDTSKYWMWVLNTYKDKFAQMYNASIPNIPDSWKDISKENALESLN